MTQGIRNDRIHFAPVNGPGHTRRNLVDYLHAHPKLTDPYELQAWEVATYLAELVDGGEATR